MKDFIKNLHIEIDSAVSISKRQTRPRPYLGLSAIGDHCVKKIWLSWRFAEIEAFSGRMYRLFDRGQREEETFVDLLRLVGIPVSEVDPRTGRQFEFISHKGHVRGHCDGICYLDGKQVLVEMKTHNSKSFVTMSRASSLEVGKNQHYCQMQLYMDRVGTKHGLYCAVNKDNDSLYFEYIKRDNRILASMEERIVEILNAKTPPAGVADEPGFWLCNFCSYNEICFSGGPVRRSCRMCSKSELGSKGSWLCNGNRLSFDKQLRGCDKWKSV